MWTYSPQKRQAGLAFALMYSLLLRSCKLTDAFIIHPAFLLVGVITNSRASSLHGHYPLRRYCWPLRHPLAFPPTSWFCQIALFVAPMLLLLSYVLGPRAMDLLFWPGAVVMILIATMAAALVTSSGRSTWFVGVFILMVYLVFGMTLYLLPPRAH